MHRANCYVIRGTAKLEFWDSAIDVVPLRHVTLEMTMDLMAAGGLTPPQQQGQHDSLWSTAGKMEQLVDDHATSGSGPTQVI